VAGLALPTAAAEEEAGEKPVERPSYLNLRYEEDWSVLPGVSGPSRFLDPIKYIPFDEDGQFWISFGGELRARLEIWNNFRFGSSQPKSDDTYLLGRVFVHADLHLTKYFRAFAQFKSAFLTDRELDGGRRAVDEDLAALQNAFGEIRLPGDGFEVGLQGGRREMQYGTQRLVSPLDWANARRTFDGATVYASGDRWEASGIWARPVIVKQRGANRSSSAEQLYGIYATVPLLGSGLDIDLYWLGLHLDADTARATNETPGEVDRQTLGGRIFGTLPSSPLQIEIEGAVQLGSVGGEDILAGMIATLFTWPFSNVTLEPSVYLGYDWASGDESAGGKVGTFDHLYPLGHAYLGLIDVTARQNIHALQGGVSVSPYAKTKTALTMHSFWLAEVGDALYDAGGAVIRFDPAADNQHVGIELDLTFTYAFTPGLSSLVGYSHFFTGEYLEQADPDNHKDEDFGYIQLMYKF